MITIQQTADITADQRLHLDMALPRTVPSGRTNVVLVFPDGKEPPHPYTPDAIVAVTAVFMNAKLVTGDDRLCRLVWPGFDALQAFL
jgi:hypothetical protein